LATLKICLKKLLMIWELSWGSFAKGQHLPDSDVDIAVYFNPAGRALEWEEDTLYPEEDRIWRELENLLDREVDLLVLNRAASPMASKVLKYGLPILIKDRFFYWRFFLTVNSASADFKEFIQDINKPIFFEIKNCCFRILCISFSILKRSSWAIGFFVRIS